MGEVWKAHDARLRRDVAIKALPGALAGDADRLARLEREAALLATLNHPHIAAIYGLEQLQGHSFLVLELVEGDTLEEALLRGPIPVEEALPLALQLAQALEAAHAKQIIHRDLKPANIKVTPDRRIKVLDFGIAKALIAAGTDETQALSETQMGAVIGTPAYMSPEQARGETVGFQTDVWSFGAVLYEMLTGISPFKRQTTADTLASVLGSQPDPASLPPLTHSLARRLVQRCLEKRASSRLQHMSEVRVLLEEALASGASIPRAAPTHRGRRGPWIAIGVLTATLAGVLTWFAANGATAEKPAHPVYVSMTFAGLPFAFPFGRKHLAISPDGSSIAFATSAGVQIRRMDEKDGITVTTGPSSNPFFSPDGEWVGLFVATGLVKVPARGGTPLPLVNVTDRPAGGAWRADGTIVYATSQALYKVSANGGAPTVIATPDRSRKETLYAFPQFVAGGPSILFTIVSEDASASRQTVLLDLETLERKPLLRGSSAVYVPDGQLLYATDSTLTAVGFDATAGTLIGKPVPIVGLQVAVAEDNGAANFAISDTGTLIFTAPAGLPSRVLEWIDRQGQRETLPVEPQNYGYAMVSPDGTRIAVERTTRANRDIWILDLKRLTQTQLTEGPTEDILPVWSRDSQRVFFSSQRTGNFEVYSQAADGASAAKLEFAGPEFQAPSTVTADGTRLIVYDRFKDLAIVNLGEPARLEPLLHSDFDERLGQLSPDGRWLAYESNESGEQFDVVLRSFPDVHDRRETVSVNGGRYPRWGPRGSNELYYVNPEGAMMAATVKLSPTLTLGRPKKLFDWQKPGRNRSGQIYDVAPDGRFLMTRSVAPNTEDKTSVSVILNWLGTVRQPRR